MPAPRVEFQTVEIEEAEGVMEYACIRVYDSEGAFCDFIANSPFKQGTPEKEISEYMNGLIGVFVRTDWGAK